MTSTNLTIERDSWDEWQSDVKRTNKKDDNTVACGTYSVLIKSARFKKIAEQQIVKVEVKWLIMGSIMSLGADTDGMLLLVSKCDWMVLKAEEKKNNNIILTELWDYVNFLLTLFFFHW